VRDPAAARRPKLKDRDKSPLRLCRGREGAALTVWIGLAERNLNCKVTLWKSARRTAPWGALPCEFLTNQFSRPIAASKPDCSGNELKAVQRT
jgi:hypothetical protein